MTAKGTTSLAIDTMQPLKSSRLLCDCRPLARGLLTSQAARGSSAPTTRHTGRRVGSRNPVRQRSSTLHLDVYVLYVVYLQPFFLKYNIKQGCPLSRPHTCAHCGEDVDQYATHGLSCKWSQGRYSRHGELNDIIHRALVSAKVPSANRSLKIRGNFQYSPIGNVLRNI